MRLNRFLAGAGLGSRRSVEELISEGRVKINGRVVTELATMVSPEDTVKVGNRVVQTQHTVHAVMNKPKGVVCTADDERGRPTIYNFLPEEWPRVFHVGRLDKESEGLLIVTNDGDLSLALTHPRYKMEKEYEVTLDKPYDPAHTAKLLRGFHIIGGKAKMAEVEQEGPKRLRIVLTQGIKRQIRLMLYEMGYEVERLVRVRIGPIVLTKFPPGTWRMLSPHEVAELKGESPARPRPIAQRSAKAREGAARAAEARTARDSQRRDSNEESRPRGAAGRRGPERRDNKRGFEERERSFKPRFGAARGSSARDSGGTGARRDDWRGSEEKEQPPRR
ncbi:MAG: rRNA pseudouridine synthase, partial [Verrucomicrobiaceae bacterium]